MSTLHSNNCIVSGGGIRRFVSNTTSELKGLSSTAPVSEFLYSDTGAFFCLVRRQRGRRGKGGGEAGLMRLWHRIPRDGLEDYIRRKSAHFKGSGGNWKMRTLKAYGDYFVRPASGAEFRGLGEMAKAKLRGSEKATARVYF